jgi:hypothetical protein
VSIIGSYKPEIGFKELMIKTIIQKLNDTSYLLFVIMLLQLVQILIIAVAIIKLS